MFPTGPVDPDSGRRAEEPYFKPAEVAKILHVSAVRVRKMAESEEWPSLIVANHVYFSQDHIDTIFALSSRGPHRLRDHSEVPTRLGVPVDDADLESLT